jgi:hypothetical protein
MAGYSGRPLAQKLGIKAHSRVALVHAPPGFAETLADLPEGVGLEGAARGKEPFDIILLFSPDESHLREWFPKLAVRLAPAGGLWVAWPKKASGVTTDLSEDVVRTIGLACRLVDNKVCAVDETWSGLRFVIRLADRRPRSQRA